VEVLIAEKQLLEMIGRISHIELKIKNTFRANSYVILYNIKIMNKIKGTIIYLIFISIFVLVVIGYNFVHYYIIRNYPVQVFTACNPIQHNCFVADPNTADPTFQATLYSKVKITALYAPSCLEEHTCSDFTCDGIMGACVVKYCSETTREDGETCSNH
jgi:hypothetical protein